MTDGVGNTIGRFLDEWPPVRLHPIGRRGERQRGDQAPGVVPNAGRDAAHANLRFLAVGRPAGALDALELALELREVGDGVLGMRREPRALRIVAKARKAVLQ